MSTEEATHARNGTAGPPVDPLDLIAEQLEEEKAPLTARRAQLEAEIAELMRREDRINAALAGLTGGKPRPKPNKQRDSHAWTPSQKTLDDVYAAMATADGPLTIAQIVDKTDVSASTVKKAVDELRKTERIRLAGTAPMQGSPKTYGLMR